MVQKVEGLSLDNIRRVRDYSAINISYSIRIQPQKEKGKNILRKTRVFILFHFKYFFYIGN